MIILLYIALECFFIFSPFGVSHKRQVLNSLSAREHGSMAPLKHGRMFKYLFILLT